MSLKPYIAIARPDHWVKNIFILPGVLIAIFFGALPWNTIVSLPVLIGIAATCLVASANYVINEILDAETDRFHPDKKQRPIPAGLISIPAAYGEYTLLAVAGVGLAFTINMPLGLCVLSLLIMGAAYNVRPIRSKDRPYLDVLSESVNNPIRLLIGWYATGQQQLPTLSVVMAYWMFGAFLMAVKRFAEYRHIDDTKAAASYRMSFRHYTEEYLQLSILFYATFFGMCSGVFIARYRVELILATPLVALALAQYLHVGYKENSVVQHPEHLYHDKKLILVIALALVLCTILLFVDIPAMTSFFDPRIEPPR
jgi:decaprenyl-phosphate phosphoribosyltransferase